MRERKGSSGQVRVRIVRHGLKSIIVRIECTYLAGSVGFKVLIGGECERKGPRGVQRDKVTSAKKKKKRVSGRE